MIMAQIYTWISLSSIYINNVDIYKYYNIYIFWYRARHRVLTIKSRIQCSITYVYITRWFKEKENILEYNYRYVKFFTKTYFQLHKQQQFKIQYFLKRNNFQNIEWITLLISMFNIHPGAKIWWYFIAKGIVKQKKKHRPVA